MPKLTLALAFFSLALTSAARADLGKPEYRLKNQNLALCQDTERVIKQTTRLASDYFLADDQARSAALTKARDTMLAAYSADMGCPALVAEYKAYIDQLRATCDAIDERFHRLEKRYENDILNKAQATLRWVDERKTAGCHDLPQ